MKLPVVTIECSSANTSNNATLMVFVKARKGLGTNSFISRTPWTRRGLRSLAAAAGKETHGLMQTRRVLKSEGPKRTGVWQAATRLQLYHTPQSQSSDRLPRTSAWLFVYVHVRLDSAR